MSTQSQIELGFYLSPLTELASKMILAGTLKKNVVKHFTNKGLSIEASQNIVDCGQIKAENFMNKKAN